MNDFENLFAFSADERETWGADPFGTQTAFLDGKLDVLNELDMDVEVKEWGEPAVDFASFVPFTGPSEFPEVLVFSGESDAAAGDPAIDAENGTFEDQIIDAGKNGEAIADEIADIGNSAGIAGTFFQGYKVFFLGQFGEHFRGDVVGVADRVIVDHERQAGGFGSRLKVGHGFAGITPIEHGGHKHAAIDAESLDIAQVAASFGGAGFSNAAENGNAAANDFDHGFDNLAFFVGTKGLIFTKRAEENNAGNAGVD